MLENDKYILQEWLITRRTTSPMTNLELKDTNLIPCKHLKIQIQQFIINYNRQGPDYVQDPDNVQGNNNVEGPDHVQDPAHVQGLDHVQDPAHEQGFGHVQGSDHVHDSDQ